MDPANAFDPEALRLPQADRAELLFRPSTKPPRHRPGERFLKGPIPWPWLEQAARLPGKALALSLALWREAGYRRRRTVRLCLARVELGVSEQAARRALRSLRTAGLVTVRREPGRGLEVTLLDWPPLNGTG
jgi:hypothetical protein